MRFSKANSAKQRKAKKMNATGKRMRKQTGLTKAQVHFSKHTNKSDAKRQRAGWGEKGHRQQMKEGKFSLFN